jgi:hypothetical protein
MNDFDIKKISSGEYWDWKGKNKPVDIEDRYVKELNNLLSEFGYDVYSKRRHRNDMSSSHDDQIYIFDMTFDLRDYPKVKKLKPLSIEVEQFDDEWFILKFWNNYASSLEKLNIYVCDQMDSVIHQLEQCLKTFPKTKNPKWNKEIQSEFIKRRDELIKNVTNHIMTFTDFKQLDEFGDYSE